MDRRVFLLALAPLAFGTGAFGFTGLLEEIARDLSVSIGDAGQIAAVLAVTVALSAPVLAALAAGVERRALLTWALVGYAGANLACALAPDYPALLAFRVGAGLAGAVMSPIATTLGAALVPPQQRGAALAVIFSGVAMSFLLGVPASAFVGAALGWRAAFMLAAAFALLVAVLLRVVLPKSPAPDVRPGLKVFAVALKPALTPWLACTALIFMATQTTVAYLAPVARTAAGVGAGQVGAIQACIGLGSLVGLALGGRMAGRAGRGLPAFFAVVIFTQLGYTALLLRPEPSPLAVAGLAVVVLVGAAALFGSVPVLQARLMEAAGPAAAPFALALNSSMIFLGQGLGAALGGAITDQVALTFVGAAGAVVALVGVAVSAMGERRPRLALAATAQA
jgi:MFS transporter, DHA1 family, inner membrane transport protein